MGMRQGRSVQSSQHKLRVEPFAFTANSTSAPAESTFQGAIESVTRTGTGTFEVVVKQKYVTFFGGFSTVTSTAGTKTIVKAVDMDSRTITVETRKASATASVVPAWITEVAVDEVTFDATLAVTGNVIAVHMTTGDVTGPAQMISAGTPATGQVKVEYDGGLATLTFFEDDAVEDCSVLVAQTGPNAQWESVAVSSHTATLTGRKGYIVSVDPTAGTDLAPSKIISEGTPGDKECLVEYASGVPTLTFAAADAVTAAAVQFIPMDLVSEPLVDTTESVAFVLLCSASAHQIR